VKPEERLPLSRPEDIETLRATIARGASDSEMGLFVQVCQRLRLDPFAKQIYLVKRPGQPASIQASIDGLRVVAERSGDYEGQQAPQWCGADGVWRDVWLAKEAPAAAKVGVYRRGFREPMVRIAKLSAYQQPGPFWSRMPEHMLAKVAEALALRAAFPHDLSGVYAPEEMGEHGAVIEHDDRAHSTPSKPAPTVREPEVIEVRAEPVRSEPKRESKPESKPELKPTKRKPTKEEQDAVLAKVQAVIPEARLSLDPDEQVTLAELDPRTQRAALVRRFAAEGVRASDLELWLGCKLTAMQRDQGDELTEILAKIKAGIDTWQAAINARLKE
jgi:phage recombination protein Bet